MTLHHTHMSQWSILMMTTFQATCRAHQGVSKITAWQPWLPKRMLMEAARGQEEFSNEAAHQS